MKRVIAIILLAAQLSACYSWQPASLAPEPAAGPQTVHTRIRVRDASGTWIELTDARREGDSVHARLAAPPFRDTTIALADARAVEEAKLDGQKLTRGITITAVVSLALVGIVVALASMGPDLRWTINNGGVLGP